MPGGVNSMTPPSDKTYEELINEELRSVTFKVPVRMLAVIDQRAEERGVSRSDYLRNLLDRDIISA